MKSDVRIAGIGEILMDVFEDGTATVGGAPINVGFHVHQLLQAAGRGSGAVVSSVGRDQRGEHILEYLQQAGLSTQSIAIDEIHPTGIATVFVRGGEAGYDIAQNVAWDHLSDNASLASLALDCSAVAFGSLAQRGQQSRTTIQTFVATVAGHRLYDVNLRVNATDGSLGYSAEILHESCRLATIVKANSGEMDEVMHLLELPIVDAQGETRLWTQMEQLRDKFGLFAVVVTRGALGTMVLGAECSILLPDSTLAAEDVHPVGAGDAFSAGLLYGLSLTCTLAASARMADRLASWVTHYRSATPTLTPAILAELRGLQGEPSVSFSGE